MKTLFQQQVRHVPAVDANDWLLVIDGYVSQSLTIKYSTFTNLSAITVHAALMCAGHTPSGPLLGEATWRGVPFSEIIQRVQPDESTHYATFSSADGYRTSFTLPQLDGAFLVHTMNGEPLPAEHGFPLRLIVPGLAGYKMPKWITHITFSDQPTPGFWERRGLPTSGAVDPIATVSAAFNSAAVTLSGAAYGGKQPVRAVELRIDGGPWQRVDCAGEAGRLAHWQTTWTPSAPGAYTIEARAITGDDARSQTQATVIEVTA